MPDVVLRLENVKKYFELERSILDRLLSRRRRFIRAVDGVSIDVYEGEVLGVVGESGCGKSTLGRVIIGLLKPDEGKVLYRSKLLGRELDIASLKDKELRFLRRELQIIFQDPYSALNPRMKIGDFIGHPLEIHGIARGEEKREIVYKMLEKVGLVPPEEFYYRYPHELSGGQRQRVVIARALILKPRLVVADEPTSNLDVSIQAKILGLLMKLKDELGLTYVFITHNLALAHSICSRIAVMYLGKIMELAPSEEIVSEPLHPYTELLRNAVIEPGRKLPNIHVLGDVPSPIDPPPGCRFRTRCPYRRDICEKEPPLIEVKPGHLVRCWLYVRR